MKKYLFVLLIGAIAVLACSRVEVAMNWADTFTAAEVDKYFDMTSQQSKDLKTSIQKDLGRIKHELFPRWADFLKRVDAELQKGNPSEAVYQKYVDEGMEDFRKAEPYFANTAVGFIATVSQAQLDHLEKVVRKKNKEDQEKVQNSEKIRDESRKKYLRWTDLWVGSLTKEQEKLLEDHLQQHPFPLELQLKNKEYRLSKLEEVRKSPEALKAFTRQYVEHNHDLVDPAYKPVLEAYEKEVEKLGYQFLQTLTDRQKKTIHENLQEKISSLEKLSKD